MNNHPLRLLIVLCILLITSCTSNSEFELDQTEATEKISENPIEIEILNLVNNHRVANGYATLDKLQAIKSQTNNHTNYMIEKEKISHDFFFERKEYLNKNVNSKSVAENVAYGYSSASSVLNAWLKSKNHKKNIEGDFTHFEITAKQDLKGNWYYTNIFVKK
ncbi:CAP domain-containing protein [Tenacibaculum ovolyticum]|uniref:CAP domain-containing protein n=1 Tax=Tenacibaculum ovolyticum TaxID=104270 RepID=UPI003BACFECC